MNIHTLKSSAAAPFAALFGISLNAKKSEGDDDKKKDEDGDDKGAKKSKAEDGDDDKDEDKNAKKSEGDDDKKKDEDGDDKGAKKSKAEDDDDDEEMKGEARGRSAERARWTSVLAHGSAVGRGESACTLLATTSLSADQIVGVLNGLPAADQKASRRSLDDRMAVQPARNPGSGGAEKPADGPAATAAAMTAVYDRAIGRTPK